MAQAFITRSIPLSPDENAAVTEAMDLLGIRSFTEFARMALRSEVRRTMHRTAIESSDPEALAEIIDQRLLDYSATLRELRTGQPQNGTEGEQAAETAGP